MTTLLTLPGHDATDTAPLGTWLKIPAVEPVEIMALAGMDFVVVDLEHAPLTLETAYRLITVASLSGMSPLVRVPDHGASTIARVLDAGAHGILVPRVESVSEARAVARAVRFPPSGDRGSGSTSRAGRWGLLPTPDYLAFGNERALCIPQLESAPAVMAAADIAALADVDAIFVGAVDLALTMGAGPGDPRVAELVQHAVQCAAEAGKPCGLAFGAHPAAGANAAATGAGFIVLANDATMLATAARSLVQDYRSRDLGAARAAPPDATIW